MRSGILPSDCGLPCGGPRPLIPMIEPNVPTGLLEREKANWRATLCKRLQLSEAMREAMYLTVTNSLIGRTQ